MSTKSFAGLVGLALLGALGAPRGYGQGLGNSPYSRLGLGDLPNGNGGVRQQGMGGAGIALPNTLQVNDLNPALLYYTTRTTFELGVTGQYKKISNQVASVKDGSANLGYLALALPISKRMAVSLGVRPYSMVDYANERTEAVAGDTKLRAYKRFEGEGGLTQVYAAQGIRVAKNLTIGLTETYLFGNITQKAKSTLYSDSTGVPENATTTVITDQLYYSDFSFRAGAHYRAELNSKLNLGIGGTYGFGSKLDGTRDQLIQREDLEGRISESQNAIVQERGYAQLPVEAQLGFSLDNNRSWGISADVTHTKWNSFRNFQGLSGTTTPLHNTYRAALGVEFTPDAASVDNYFKRVTYRVGATVAQMPYQPAGQQLYDRSVSWGFTLPVPSATVLESAGVNLAFTYGVRGNTKANAELPSGTIREQYVRAQLGFSLNNRWFLKRRLE